ncbi:MAG TPA: Gfo/Idh/MocA family oxidoreductase [Candidatus Limnocylindrales bacterium]|nr:Gfo/Idh/MocA family oxidoreductase [Candidatus Limnocylindrales bacterium]
MKPISRRDFLKRSITTSAALSLHPLVFSTAPSAQAGSGDTVRLAVIGLGSTTAVGGVGGRGHQLIPRLREVPGAKIVALCDVDQTFIDREARPFKERGDEIATYTDLRRVFDDKTIDAVVIALPNHWHALAAVWACQAGKDVYVEKPFSYNLWEGQQMVAAARKYGRMVQVGTQNRSSQQLRRTFEQLRGGELGPIRFAHALVYRPRDGIGKVERPTPVPPAVNYDLWCGPAANRPLMRKQLHYEWHWFWDTGNGEMGNNGVHVIDLCRLALGQDQPAPRAISIGGRLGFDDCGETANTQIALFNYQPAPLICEIRNVSIASPNAIGKFRNQTQGIIIDCEGGYFAGDSSGGGLFDKTGKKIKDIDDNGESKRLETAHLTNFIAAVRSRKVNELAAEALEGYRSTACCHIANVSHRLGKQTPPDAIREAARANHELEDAFDRCNEYLRQNSVDLRSIQATLGPWVTFDATQQKFVHDFADKANQLSQREYRAPFVVPKIA